MEHITLETVRTWPQRNGHLMSSEGIFMSSSEMGSRVSVTVHT